MRLTQPTGRPNFHELQIGDKSVWFSYETPIAVKLSNEPVFVSENEWGPTTGKHINYVKREYGEYLQVEHDIIRKEVVLLSI